ncbi:MAG: helix-turn-helix domain-containing protein [Actinobacteria bacterium]|nr:helix-turn-helix domain-containing protein [Actinomycetota bacterium]
MYLACKSKDPRFDGWFFVGVTSTGIYCRPSCPAITPKRANVRFFTSAAAAQHGGFRACKRCRPDAVPGSPEWNMRSDLVGRAMRMIADGVVDRDGVRGLASRLGYSERHLDRVMVAEMGAGPLALARAERAQTARILIETTEVAMAEVAFASGFASVRQFNETIQQVFAMKPTQMRRSRLGRTQPSLPGSIQLRLPYRAPYAARHLFGFLATRAVAGVEEGSPEYFARTLSLPHGSGTVRLDTRGDEKPWIDCTLRLDDLRDLSAAVERSRRLLDLDADPSAVSAHLSCDPALRAHMKGHPGVRVPGHVDGAEVAMRAVLGQQVSVSAATKSAEQLVRNFGKPLTAPVSGLTHRFPTPDAVAEACDEDLPMPGARRNAMRALCRSIADADITLDAGADRDEVSERLLRIPGIGPWTVAYIRMRALSDPDVFMPTDLGVKHALAACGLPSDPKGALQVAERWRPWRSYALQYLWASTTGPTKTTTSNRRTS